jgi:hypothetical protein
MDFLQTWFVLRLRNGFILRKHMDQLPPVATGFYQLHIIHDFCATATTPNKNSGQLQPLVWL